MNPEEEEEEEEEEEVKKNGEGEEEEGEGETVDSERNKAEDEEEEEEGERKELGLDGRIIEPTQTKAEEAGVTLPGQTSQDTTERIDLEESLQKHRDSASTLGQSSNHQSSPDDMPMASLSLEEHDGGRVMEKPERGEHSEGVSLLGMIDAEVMDRRGEKNDGDPSTVTMTTDSSTQFVVSVEADSSTEPRLKPINEEPQSQDQR